MPENLKAIIDDPEKRKKLIIYINPPYAEAASSSTVKSNGANRNKAKVSNESAIYKRYAPILGKAFRELFAQFLFRIYKEIPGCVLGEFSKLKVLQGPNFKAYRDHFKAKLKNLFLVPADTFDNVVGKFPIGFFIWDTGIEEPFSGIVADWYDAQSIFCGKKNISKPEELTINDWLKQYVRQHGVEIGAMCCKGTDFQNNNYLNIDYGQFLKGVGNSKGITRFTIVLENLIESCIYFSARSTIEPTWLEDRDQFLYPNDRWKEDLEFQANCIVFTLFHGQNRISYEHGPNHWIPFTAAEVGANDNFKSTIMSDFLAGKVEPPAEDDDLFSAAKRKRTAKPKPVKLSREAKAVMAAGRELWRYYHKQPKANPNASFYDIRLHFQGMRVTAKGKEMMNSDSSDATYTKLLAKLRTTHKALAKAIEPKVYEYGFLKR